MNFDNTSIPVSMPSHLMQMAGNDISNKSMLMLFSPRPIINHYKFPLSYNFTDATVESVVNNLIQHPTSENPADRIINGTRDIYKNVIPAINDGIPLNTSLYSDHWMFVLIIDDDSLRQNMYSRALSNRTLLMGICTQEPISQFGIQSDTPERYVNPNCELIVTRHLNITKYATEGRNGVMVRDKTTVDDTIVQFDDRVWNNDGSYNDSNQFFPLLPSEAKRVTSSELTGVNAVIDYSKALNNTRQAPINATLESPRTHIKEIITGLESGYNNVLHGEDLGLFSSGTEMLHTPKERFTEGVFDSFDYISNSNGLNATSTIQNLSNMYLSIGTVMSQYRPTIRPIITTPSTMLNIIPQSDLTVNNVFSSLVCSVIPTFLNNVGLSSVTFEYNSYHDAFRVHNIIGNIGGCSDDVLKHKWESFVFLVRKELFPVLYDNAGHFDLKVVCNTNGTTDVILNFLDFTLLPMDSVYQENTILGGMTSPLIGNTDKLRDNAIKLHNFVGQVKAWVNA